MEYAEEVKKEAEEVAKKYMPLAYNSSPINPDLSSYRVNVEYSYKCAIQDRQSVLDNNMNLVAKMINKQSKWAVILLSNEIQSLTQQIEYLKSKL